MSSLRVLFSALLIGLLLTAASWLVFRQPSVPADCSNSTTDCAYDPDNGGRHRGFPFAYYEEPVYAPPQVRYLAAVGDIVIWSLVGCLGSTVVLKMRRKT